MTSMKFPTTAIKRPKIRASVVRFRRSKRILRRRRKQLQRPRRVCMNGLAASSRSPRQLITLATQLCRIRSSGSLRKIQRSGNGTRRVAAELGRSLDFAKVPAREKGEVLAAFAAHKKEVTAGYETK